MTRVPRLAFPLTALLLLGGKCGGDEPADDSVVETDADTDADSDTDTDADSDPGLPDLTDQMEPDYCDNQSAGHESWVGATEYYLGELVRQGSSGWAGTETLYIFATTEWESNGGADCVAVWDLTGTTASPSGCGSCDYAIAIDATLNTTATTCGSTFTLNAETYSVTYDVAEPGDGSASFYFHDSGNPLGQGYTNEQGVNYLSNRSCAWF